MVNEHITHLGYRLEFADDPAVVAPLLKACSLTAVDEVESPDWERSQYLLACTRAGGTAATVGWSRVGDDMILHSLAVAPTSRGSGIAAGLVASALGHLMDKRPVARIYLTTTSGGARRIFASMGFHTHDGEEEIPAAVLKHPTFADRPDGARVMVRDYSARPRGLDNYAFRLILNETEDATLPLGSVFFFRQTSNVLEGFFRGGPVVRGHLIGMIDDEEINFCWQHLSEGRLMNGDGHITLDSLPDGRRELREEFQGSGTLLLREV